MAWVHIGCVQVDEDNIAIGRGVILMFGSKDGSRLKVDAIVFTIDKSLVDDGVHDEEGNGIIIWGEAWKWRLSRVIEVIEVSCKEDCLAKEDEFLRRNFVLSKITCLEINMFVWEAQNQAWFNE